MGLIYAMLCYAMHTLVILTKHKLAFFLSPSRSHSRPRLVPRPRARVFLVPRWRRVHLPTFPPFPFSF